MYKTKKKKEELLFSFILLIVSLVVFFFIFEGFFRIYLGSNLHYEYEDDLWFLKPNQKGFTYPNNEYATINSEGYRGNLIDPKKDTILFLGDSLVFGYAIGDNDTLTENLLKEFEGNGDFNIINGGVPGYGISQMIRLYTTKYAKYEPDYVVVSFIEADIFRQGEKDPNYSKRNFARKLIRASSFIAFIKPRLEVFRQLIVGSEGLKTKNYDLFLENDMNKLKMFDEFLESRHITLILHPWIYGKDQSIFYDKVFNTSFNYKLNVLPNYYSFVFEEYLGEVEDLYVGDGHPSGIQNARLAENMVDDLLDFVAKN